MSPSCAPRGHEPGAGHHPDGPTAVPRSRTRIRDLHTGPHGSTGRTPRSSARAERAPRTARRRSRPPRRAPELPATPGHRAPPARALARRRRSGRRDRDLLRGAPPPRAGASAGDHRPARLARRPDGTGGRSRAPGGTPATRSGCRTGGRAGARAAADRAAARAAVRAAVRAAARAAACAGRAGGRRDPRGRGPAAAGADPPRSGARHAGDGEPARVGPAATGALTRGRRS